GVDVGAGLHEEFHGFDAVLVSKTNFGDRRGFVFIRDVGGHALVEQKGDRFQRAVARGHVEGGLFVVEQAMIDVGAVFEEQLGGGQIASFNGQKEGGLFSGGLAGVGIGAELEQKGDLGGIEIGTLENVFQQRALVAGRGVQVDGVGVEQLGQGRIEVELEGSVERGFAVGGNGAAGGAGVHQLLGELAFFGTGGEVKKRVTLIVGFGQDAGIFGEVGLGLFQRRVDHPREAGGGGFAGVGAIFGTGHFLPQCLNLGGVHAVET